MKRSPERACVTGEVIAWAGNAARPANIDELDYPPAFIRALGMITGNPNTAERIVADI
mgnify:CR=1 FL=1